MTRYCEYFLHLANTARRRHLGNDALLVHTKAIHVETRGGYGRPCTGKGLRVHRTRVGKERMKNLMRLYDIRTKGKPRFKVTAERNQSLPISLNLIDLLSRKFVVAASEKL